MSAPPLPDAFGNYALGDFVEVVSPQAVSWLPQTPGWWWLGAGLLALCLHRAWQRLRHWYRNRYRREAEERLQRLRGAAAGPELVSEANKLLKLAAMAAYSREGVARLSGRDWVDFLERCYPEPLFSEEHNELLAVGAYRLEAPGPGVAESLLDACILWVRGHQAMADV